MQEKDSFKPYISADKVKPEFTFLSVTVGLLLAVIFGAANAYLGLRVGMTVSASIPAAVIGMGVIKLILRKNSVLEGNMIQTIGSAGESLAAGAIFTVPALFLWASEGIIDEPSLIEITLISLFGGVLGVLFMVPLRRALIVEEHGNLPYPEGTACAEVMLAGEKEGSNAAIVFIGMFASILIKFILDGLKVAKGTIVVGIDKLKTEVSAQVYPAVIAVGYICGPKIASYMFAGGLIGWLVFIPMIVLFGADTILYPGTVTISEMYSAGGASEIWKSYIRYIGAGCVAAGGIISLIKTAPMIVNTFVGTLKSFKKSSDKKDDTQELRTDVNIGMPFILITIAVIAVLMILVPSVPVGIVGAILILIFGFFFAAVSSRMVGLVGSSNNPVSGMAIATLLFSTIILKATGKAGAEGMVGAIAIGSIICIIAAMAGDTSQDLKAGYILGATPKKQQIGELLGAVVSAFAIGGVLFLLNESLGFGTSDLSAPQATLMKTIVEGVMGGNLPWGLVFIGIFTAIVIEILHIPVLPVAIGLYLPLELSACIMIGGVVRFFVEKKKYSGEKAKEASVANGILVTSGMIAGEGLCGIVLALLTFVEVKNTDLLSFIGQAGEKVQTGYVGGVILLFASIFMILKFTIWNKEKSNAK